MTTKIERLRALVPIMRELGVEEAFGVVLGPPPRPLTKLEAIAARPDATPEEREAAKRDDRIEAERQRVADLLGVDLELMSDEETASRIDLSIDPSVFE